MDTGVIRSPLPAYTAITPETRAPQRNEPAAKTDNDIAKTVTPSGESSAQRPAKEERNQGPVGGQQLRDLVRKNKLDPESQSLIYVAMDRESGEVVTQVPSETLRRLRAYAISTDNQENQDRKASVIRTA
ncbi:hypothetical protein [Pannonibacter carbonis]|uniref:hypothetical protein n=1 Tax=Pannonibacter carbonis TaxID=2067569 RepID=UPI000D10F519|nr:hypothetical protein [Pannonibacter carbonis]